MQKTLILLLLSTLGWTIANGQSLPDSTSRKIDALFKKWDDPNKPGCVVGIIRNDSLIYSKGYGLANVEQHIPNAPKSIYYMCSVSKQFTGYAIALLVQQGKVKLDANIHTYLPWMGNLGSTVTVRNLLNHTSGIRDDINLSEITGLPITGMLTQDLAVQLLKKQRSLNFAPDEKFSYSNSNYVLLAEIVKMVSGQPFRAFADEQIFKPLGMVSSHFVDDPDEVIADRAPSYTPNDKRVFKNSLQNVYTMGDGGLFTNIIDMARWVMNYYSPTNQKVISQMTEQGILNSGKSIKYAFGISIEESRGWKQYMHNGGLAGYRTIIAVYPELKTGFLIFCNSGEGDAIGKVNQLAALFIPNKKTAVTPALPAPVKRDSSLALVKNETVAKQLTGSYYADNGYHINISLIRGKLWVNEQMMLARDSGNNYSLLNNAAVKYTFSKVKGALNLSLMSPVLDKPILLEKIQPVAAGNKELAAYAGSYNSPELDYSFRLVVKNGLLYLINRHFAEIKAELQGKDRLVTEDDGLKHFKAFRNEKGTLLGFELNNGEMMHLRFYKTDRP